MKNILYIFILFPFFAKGQIIMTIAGSGNIDSPAYCCDGGPATDARLAWAEGVYVDKQDNIYIADALNSRIRKINRATGIITTIAGIDSAKVDGYTTHGLSGDNGPATNARLYFPDAIFMDTSGNIYIADGGNNRIRKITAATGIITTIAGTGATGLDSGGVTGDGGAATNAKLGAPSGLCLDKYGNIYIADTRNNKVREINAITGIINTVAGTGIQGYTGDGGMATNAELSGVLEVFVDSFGNIFICDAGNNVVRKVMASTGIISTIAGNGIAGFSGDGGIATNAKLNQPGGIYVDSNENIYIADYANGSVRKVDGSTGIITTVAGTGSVGFYGDGGPATDAKTFAADVFLDSHGNIIIADMDVNRVREVVEHPLEILCAKSDEQIVNVFPNPANTLINFQFSTPADATIKITNIEGQVLQTVPVSNATITTINIAGYAPGMYLYQMVTKTQTQVGKVMKE